MSKSSRPVAARKAKPHPDFPLFKHATCRRIGVSEPDPKTGKIGVAGNVPVTQEFRNQLNRLNLNRNWSEGKPGGAASFPPGVEANDRTRMPRRVRNTIHSSQLAADMAEKRVEQAVRSGLRQPSRIVLKADRQAAGIGARGK